VKKEIISKSLIFILGGIFFSIISVYAAAQILASDIAYKNTTVDKALDELYDAVDNTSEGLIGYYKVFDYTGKIQSTTIPKSGYYQLEAWGAQGGSVNSYIGGYGGYSTGVAHLEKGQTLYFVVGGQGKTGVSANSVKTLGGYNGGGNNTSSTYGTGSSGGGATHIALVSGLLADLSSYKGTINDNETPTDTTDDYYVSNEILIVAAGGGGGGMQSNSLAYIKGGSGGGYIGASSVVTDNDGNRTGTNKYVGVQGATQISGTAFGKGEDSSSWLGAGGAGFYGGYSKINDTRERLGGSGGSSYIASSNLVSAKGVTKHMYCYNCTQSNSTNTETYTISNGTSSCANAKPNSDCSKMGDGYAKITYLGA